MKFTNTFCSQCGEEFGPGDHGFSSCAEHNNPYKKELLALQADLFHLFPEAKTMHDIYRAIEALQEKCK